MPECFYFWRTRPELVRFVAVALLTYIVDVARRYMAGEFDGLADWRPAVLGIVIGGVQFVGARLLAALPPTPPVEGTRRDSPEV